LVPFDLEKPIGFKRKWRNNITRRVVMATKFFSQKELVNLGVDVDYPYPIITKEIVDEVILYLSLFLGYQVERVEFFSGKLNSVEVDTENVKPVGELINQKRRATRWFVFSIVFLALLVGNIFAFYNEFVFPKMTVPLEFWSWHLILSGFFILVLFTLAGSMMKQIILLRGAIKIIRTTEEFKSILRR
jgi:uncharacterized integral membrane protein